jgi:F-type H+-transporting ATPase subunit b
MESLISSFHIDWKLMLAQMVNFAVVFFVLYRFALKPLKKLMDERGKTIAGGLENAEKQKELLSAQKAEYDATLAQARTEAATIMKEVKKDAEIKRAELLESAKEEAQALVAAGREQLKAEKEKMLGEAKGELVSMVTRAAEKVLGETVNAKVESKLVEESIKNI